ncbi:ribonuclease III domain-containing protein [Mrakia frigida]|uniref:ribonuclease III domain-containing protein n=1 Tax=Mrakia frigida TaxID=29902 RepID=UPI003FCBF203
MALHLAASERYNSFLRELSSTSLPPLPQVKRQDLRDTAFTHTSYFSKQHVDFEESSQNPNQDYERFEFIGDQIIALAATFLITSTYPLLTVGASTALRSSLVSNSTLSQISRSYSLHTQLRIHPSQSHLTSNALLRAQIFESYVAAVQIEFGLQPTLDWLTQVFHPLLQVAYEELKNAPGRRTLAERNESLENGTFVSFVSVLDEWRAKQKPSPSVEYVKVRTEGPAHNLMQFGSIRVGGVEMGEAEGALWKDVKHQLAKKAVVALEIPY